MRSDAPLAARRQGFAALECATASALCAGLGSVGIVKICGRLLLDFYPDFSFKSGKEVFFKSMEYKKVDSAYLLRIDRGEEILTALSIFCEKEGILCGSIFGIGAAERAVIGLYDMEKRQFQGKSLSGPMEITSVLGTISEMDGRPYLHCHINLCDREMHVYGGHVKECVISATCELTVLPHKGQVGRRLDEITGLNLFAF